MLENTIKFILMTVNLWSPLLAFICGAISAAVHKSRYSESILAWFCLLAIGGMGIYGFIFHIFFDNLSAQLIGWPNSPFQYEVGVANLVFGVLGICAFWGSYPFRLATGLGFAIWFFGDGIVHVSELIQRQNMAPFNSGSVLYTDLALPIICLILLYIARPSAQPRFG